MSSSALAGAPASSADGAPRISPTTGRFPTRGLVRWWVLLWILAFIQSPGRVVADTKHDLTEDPAGFLSRSLQIWSDILPLGQLQNQAYGYLFPQGAFFALADVLPDWLAPMWLVQSVWWALLLTVAFTGFYRLAEAAGVGNHPGRVFAALLFALSPRILTTLGAISSEAWPVAMAPWIALPLLRVLGRIRDTTAMQCVRAVMLSALAVLLTGAVNATSTAAACVVAGLLLVGAGVWGPGRRKAWAMLCGWIAALIVVSLWWLVPLFLLGRYAPPFTDYIESSGVTTRWMNLPETLRGTTSWAPFVSVERVGGNALVVEPVLIIATILITAVGLLGLSLADMPRRRLWWLIGAIGLISMAAWTAAFGLFGEHMRELLDGPLAALRNLHKFDPVLRIPVLLGVAHIASKLPWPSIGRGTRKTWTAWMHPEKYPRGAAAMLLLIVAVAATSPAWSGRLAPKDPYESVPAMWHQAADWLNENAADSRTMLQPSMPFADQEWGFTRDEPLQALTEVPWVVRDAIPLVPPEAIRALDGLQEELARGESVDTLAETLHTEGIGHILVRYDAKSSNRATDLGNLERTLSASPGFEHAAEFGEGTREGIVIWSVTPESGADGAALAPRIIDTSEIPLVSGGPEVLPRLDDVDGSSPVRILATEGAGTVTDTPTLRGRNYGEVTGAVSGILSPDDDPGVSNLVSDYPVDGIPQTSVLAGRGSVSASSSAADPYSFGGSVPSRSVNSLVDGNPNTWWEPSRGTGQAEWVQFDLEEPTNLATVTLTAARAPVEVRVRTDAGSTTVQLSPGDPTSVALPAGETSTVRITATDARLGFALSEVSAWSSDGTDVTPARIPAVPDASSDVQRWVLGQEISEGTMQRMITVPEDRDGIMVTLDTDTCRSGLEDSWTTLGGEDVACGEEFELAAGPHIVQSDARWVALTGADFTAPSAAEQDAALLGDGVDATDSTRIIWDATSVNSGLRATLGGEALEPVTVNGWQQGWIVPPGASGQYEVTFPAESTWRTGIIGGGVLAAIVAVIALVLWRRVEDPDETITLHDAPIAPDLPRWTAVATATATVGLVAGWQGLLVGALTALVGMGLPALGRAIPHAPWSKAARALERPTVLGSLAAAVLTLAGVLLSHTPWPANGYFDAGWSLQLLCVTSLVLVGAAQWRPSHRRAGSSTKA